MTSVTIGVHVHAEPDRLRATLSSIRRNTPLPFDLLLLPDGPDPPTRAVLTEFAALRQSATDEPCGAAACFNRLASASRADVIVLLESGCLVGRSWLEGLLAALRSDPRHGLAGPSTNQSWNEQDLTRHTATRQLLLRRGNAAGEVDRIAEVVRARFGRSVQGLEPLHSLAEFCYAVSREVIEAIGAADEAYGLGPCWEMDYNIRAARAGFRGVWACGAYVQRAPFTARRAAGEARLFEASRRRYQDKFCALRGTGAALREYEPHCRGDACEHFALTGRIRLRESASGPATVAHRVMPGGAMPMVSCIMATANRRDYVLQSISYFRRQDYPSRELLILDENDGEDLAPLIGSGDERIRYLRLPPRLSIGAKRNRGCELARGTFIAQWDDDDWYAPGRLSAQLAPLLDGSAELTALTAGVFFDLDRWEFWRCSAELHRRMFVGNVHGGTLVYHRSLIDRGLRYPDRSLAEDASFLWQAMQHGARMRSLPGEALFVYLRHGTSSWKFGCGTFLDPKGWWRVDEPALLATDRAFYQVRAGRITASLAATVTAAPPLVSCIMPTSNRRRLVPQAIRYFRRQDYPERELLILDDGADAVADLVPEDPRIRYLRIDGRLSLGAKRNLACEHAGGEIILHWDDDDWMADWRISHQVAALQAHPRAGVCGLAELYFFDPCRGAAWLYRHPRGARTWVSGNTLGYRRSVWQQHRFPDLNEGEDTVFVWSLADRETLQLDTPGFFVATVHAGNTSVKRTGHPGWHPVPVAVISELMKDDAAFYASWP
jgi:glycosyltransferase involved in cell wall biosynthesis